MSEATKYELVTLKDVFDKVPSDKIELCLKEIAMGMRQAKAIWELLEAAGEALDSEGGIGEIEWTEPTVWVDDGRGEIELNFVGGEEHLFSFQSKKVQEPK